MLLLPKSIVSVQPYVPHVANHAGAHTGIPPGSARAWIRRGKNIVIEWRRHEGKVDRLPALATELVRLKVDVIVVTGVGDLRSAKETTATIPIVMVVEVVSSPVWRKTPRC